MMWFFITLLIFLVVALISIISFWLIDDFAFDSKLGKALTKKTRQWGDEKLKDWGLTE